MRDRWLIRWATRVAVIVKSFATLTHQTVVKSHPHCSTYPETEVICSSVTKTVVIPSRRRNDMHQEIMGIYNLLVKT
jgi:hypothetical protein